MTHFDHIPNVDLTTATLRVACHWGPDPDRYFVQVVESGAPLAHHVGMLGDTFTREEAHFFLACIETIQEQVQAGERAADWAQILRPIL